MKKTITSFLLFALVALFGAGIRAQTNTNIFGVINQYASVNDYTQEHCRSFITLTSGADQFSAGDKVLIIQMKGTTIDQTNSSSYGDVTAMNGAGTFEFSYVASVGSGILNLTTDLINTYDFSASVQVVRVPVYTTASVTITGTLTCAAWDPLTGTGGILVFDAPASDLIFNANIDVSAAGFRGGAPSLNGSAGTCNNNYRSPAGITGGFKGEGFANFILNQEAAAGHIANGGGGGNDVNYGGGGGSSAGSGGQGGTGWGCTSTQSVGGGSYFGMSDRVFLGGGGGGSHQNDNAGVTGGNGGGIVMFTAMNVDGNGLAIFANGQNAPATLPSGNNDAGAGGGGGGTVCIYVNGTFTGSGLTISASGGNGGDISSSVNLGPGGGGGGGRIFHNVAGGLPGSVTTVLNGGTFGTNTLSNALGATAGNNGITEIGFYLPQGSLTTSCCPALDPAFAGEYTIFDVSLTPTITTQQVWSGKVFITGGILEFTGNIVVDITNVDVVFDNCSGLHFKDGAMLRANNSVFRPCMSTGVWAGIVLEQTQTHIVDECVFKNAVVALDVYKDAAVKAQSNFFHNNNKGIVFRNIANHPFNVAENSFVLDNDIPYFGNCTGGIISGSVGIESVFCNHTGLITNNSFVNYLDINIHQFIGITFYYSSGKINGNRFTNNYRAIDVDASVDLVTIENNTIETNTDMTSDLYQVNIINSISPVFVFFNTIKNSNKVVDPGLLNGAGIYCENQSYLNIRQNTIYGFLTGIQLHYCYNTQVSSNIINSYMNGIYIQASYWCYLSCNEINMEFGENTGNSTTGIFAFDLDESTSIVSNCISNTENAMMLYASGVTNLPVIRNNFLYNYYMYGIFTDNYNGDIGLPGQPGMNTFYSNSNALDVFNISAGTTINLYDNYNQINYNSPEVTVLSDNQQHSTASCALQTVANIQRNLDPTLVCDVYGTLIGAMRLANNTIDASKVTEQDILQIKNPAQRITLMQQVLLERPADVKAMIAKVGNTTWDDVALKYYYHLLTREYTQASSLLSSFVATEDWHGNWKTVETARIHFIKHQSLENSHTDQLQQVIAGSNDWVANDARGLLRLGKGVADFRFLETKQPTQAQPRSSQLINASISALDAFPNPSTGIFKVRYVLPGNTSGQQLTISDVTGKQIYHSTLVSAAGIVEVDLSTFSPGIYFVKVESPGNENTLQPLKVVKY